MSNEWFYSVSGVKHGPVSSKELSELAKSGNIKPGDLVWKEGMAEWKSAGKVKGLFAATETPPVPVVQSGKPVSLQQDDILEKAKGYLRKVSAAGQRFADRIQDTSTNPSGTVPPSNTSSDDFSATAHDAEKAGPISPKPSRKKLVAGGVGAAVLLLGCLVCAGIGSLLPKADGETAESKEKDRKMESIAGPKPKASTYDGSVKVVEDYLRKTLNDPKSLECVEWSNVVASTETWTVRLKYRAKNGFGGVITKNQLFHIKNEKVLYAVDFD